MPLAGKTSSHVKNSAHFVEVMRSVRIQDDEILASFDVTALFTNVPVDEAIRVIGNKLQDDETLEDRIPLSPERVTELLELCLRSTYFSYDGDFYEQREGAAMGSPVSATVANLYMEFFEDLALESAPVRPQLWKRYVDDTCCIIKRGAVTELLDHLNGIRSSIHFTVELENNGALPFLETLLRRNDDGSLDITVHRKPTHTDRYLNFYSHHPIHVKRGLVKCLFDRAKSITTTQENLQKEEEHVAEALKQNGYPSTFIGSSSRSSQGKEGDQEASVEEAGRTPLVVLPYIAGVSEDIRRVCRRFNMRVAFRSGQTLRSMLTKVKDNLPLGKRSRVVYQIPCSCGQVYIGETIRRLETRMKEHRDACERGTLEKSAIAEHAWEKCHPIKWKETAVLAQARRHKELILKEAFHIQKMPAGDRINRDVGLELPGCWMTTLRRLENRKT